MENDLDALWEAWARARLMEVIDAECKFRFELLESLARMPATQRERQLPVAANLDAIPDDPDVARFRKMQHGWMYGNSAEFRQNTLDSLGCDPEAWKRRGES